MYENLTVEVIKNDILSRLSTQINKSEGSFINDMVSALSYEIWKTYQALDSVIPIAFVDETSGQYIDKRASEFGIVRKAGTKAVTTVTFSGTNGTTIPGGTVLVTADGLQFVTDAGITIINGSGSVTATAIDEGEAYNVEAGKITSLFYAISGLTSFSCTAATGGTDPESDADLYARLDSYRKMTATSGNLAHYKQWALAVNGVGGAKVIPLWNGAGTVKVLIVDNDKQPATPEVVSNCAAYIEENRPIGATVTVLSASGLSISVSATVTINSSTTKSDVRNAFIDALYKYLQNISLESDTVVYTRIAYMLLDIPGVLDYSNLTVNGGTTNVAISAEKVPVVGTVTIN